MTHNGSFRFKHKPEVLCVAYNQSYNIRVYLKDPQGNYRHVPDHDPKYRNLISVEKMWYIVGPGSCHGDSGGPVFQPALKNGKRIFVILGNQFFTIEGKLFTIEGKLFTTEGKLFTIEKNFLTLRENFLPLKENFYHRGKTFYH